MCDSESHPSMSPDVMSSRTVIESSSNTSRKIRVRRSASELLDVISGNLGRGNGGSSINHADGGRTLAVRWHLEHPAVARGSGTRKTELRKELAHHGVLGRGNVLAHDPRQIESRGACHYVVHEQLLDTAPQHPAAHEPVAD